MTPAAGFADTSVTSKPGESTHPRAVPELSIVVPTLNERENLLPLLEALDRSLAGIAWEVIFVDDDSQDGTAELVRHLAQQDSRVRFIQRIGRRGLSSACNEGMLTSSAPYLAVMDADLQHDETLLPSMLDALRNEKLDVVVGSRYVRGGSSEKLSHARRWNSRFANELSRLVLGFDLADPMSGYFMLTREFFDRVIRRTSGKGFKLLLDLLSAADGPVRYREIPYHMRKRLSGESKLDTLVVWEFFVLLADKTVGRLVPVRFIMFVAVGAIGVVLHLELLWLIFRLLEHTFVLAQSLATAAAMTMNFVLNNLFTYRDVRLRGLSFVRGLLSFYLACAIGAVINVRMATLVYELAAPWWFAGLIGATIGSVWNYAITATFTWTKKRQG